MHFAAFPPLLDAFDLRKRSGFMRLDVFVQQESAPHPRCRMP